MEQVRCWYAGKDQAHKELYKVEEQTMFTVRTDGRRWSCSCGKRQCRHIMSAKGARRG